MAVVISGLTARQAGAIIEAMPEEISDYTVQVDQEKGIAIFRMDDPLGVTQEKLHGVSKGTRKPYLVVLRKVREEVEAARSRG